MSTLYNLLKDESFISVVTLHQGIGSICNFRQTIAEHLNLPCARNYHKLGRSINSMSKFIELLNIVTGSKIILEKVMKKY